MMLVSKYGFSDIIQNEQIPADDNPMLRKRFFKMNKANANSSVNTYKSLQYLDLCSACYVRDMSVRYLCQEESCLASLRGLKKVNLK